MQKLSNNQKLFCQEYLKLGMNVTQAYMKVYKSKDESTAGKLGSRLMKNDGVKEYIRELQEKVEDKAIVKIEDIVKELYTVAFTDRSELAKLSNENITDDETGEVIGHRTHLQITDTDKLSDDAKKLLSGYKMTQSGISVESYDKMKALELLGKYLGMFNENININDNSKATSLLESINRQISGKR